MENSMGRGAWGATAYGVTENQTHIYRTCQVALKNPPANVGDIRDTVSTPWVGKIPWRRKW